MQLVTIATFGQLAEAYMAKNLLEAEGIQVYLADEHGVDSFSPVIRPGSAPRIQVPENQAKRAAEILQAVKHPE
jgi:hypothetical protein